MDAELKRELDRINQKLTTILQAFNKPKQPSWVRASVITRLTGWNNEGMRKARDYGYIRYKEEDGFWYDLDSLHPLHLKKNRETEVA
jgi:hypothetical protein